MPATQYPNAIIESSTTTGLVAIVLGGAVTGFFPFSGLGDGWTGKVTIQGVDATTNIPTGDIEICQGTYVLATNSITRGTVETSSNANAHVNFTAAKLLVYAEVSGAQLDALCTTAAATALAAAAQEAAQAASQPLEATLTAFAALTIAANSVTLGTAADAFSQITLAASSFLARSSSGNAAAKTITDFGLSLVDDADASAARTTLGLGSAAAQSSSAFDAAGLAAAALAAAQASSLQTANALSELSSAASTARGNIGAGTGNGTVTAVTGTAPIASSGGTAPVISLNNTAVTPASYTYGSFTVDAQGRLTAASSGTAPISAVLTGYVSGAGTVSATDTILQAVQKLNGNDATNANLTGVDVTSVGNAATLVMSTAHTWTGLQTMSPPAGTKKLIALADATGADNAFEAQNSSGTAYVKIGPPLLVAGTAASNFLNVTGTLPAGINNGVMVSVTGATTNGRQRAFYSVMNAGYSGNGECFSGVFDNVSVSTGAISTAVIATSLNAITGNISCGGYSYGNTAGTNYGAVFEAANGAVSIGFFGKSVTAKNSATNIGVLGNALNAGTSPILIGGYFGLNAALPTFASAALMADNGSTTSDIFVARDNGTAVFTIADGGLVSSIGTVRVTGDVTNATGTLANITGLSFSVLAGQKVVGLATIFASNSTAIEGLQFTFDGGSATFTSFVYGIVGTPVGATLGTAYATSAATALTATTATTGDVAYLIAFEFVANAAGTVIVRGAEVSHTAGTATFRLGSFLKASVSNN